MILDKKICFPFDFFIIKTLYAMHHALHARAAKLMNVSELYFHSLLYHSTLNYHWLLPLFLQRSKCIPPDGQPPLLVVNFQCHWLSISTFPCSQSPPLLAVISTQTTTTSCVSRGDGRHESGVQESRNPGVWKLGSLGCQRRRREMGDERWETGDGSVETLFGVRGQPGGSAMSGMS